MQLQIDTREHKAELARICAQLDSLGVSYYKSKLYVGDYMSLDNPRLVIDRKKDLQEVCGNITQQHARFTAELIRANEAGIKIVILIEHGQGIHGIEDVYFWTNPRLLITDWKVIDGKPRKVQKFPRATTGLALYKSMQTMEREYGVKFMFCDKKHTGKRIVEILGGE